MGRRAGGSGVWVLIAFAILGYWVYGQTSRPDRSTKGVATEAHEQGDDVAVELPPAPTVDAPTVGNEPALERDERVPEIAVAPELPAKPVVVTPTAAQARGDNCVLSSGPFALPDGTKSVDWKIVNRADHDVDIEVTVYRLRIGDAAQVVTPGTLRKTLPSGHATHNANSVGHDQPFAAGSDYEVVVRRSDAGALPSVAFWTTLGNTEIPGTRIGPRDFVAVGGKCPDSD